MGARSGGVPDRLTGTAVAKPDDPESQFRAYEEAAARLERSAAVLGVFVGEPVLETVYAHGRGTGYQVITLTAPVLATGTDEKVEHTAAESRSEEEQ